MDFRNSEEACNKGEPSSLFSAEKRSFDLENLCKEKLGSNDTFLSSESWISIFGAMNQIALRIRKECVQIEALSIMILILMRSNSNEERKRLVVGTGRIQLISWFPFLFCKFLCGHLMRFWCKQVWAAFIFGSCATITAEGSWPACTKANCPPTVLALELYVFMLDTVPIST